MSFSKECSLFLLFIKSDLNDWTTNDRLLSVLEERIKGWHTAVLEDKQQKPGRKETLGAVRMRRWNPDVGYGISFSKSQSVFTVFLAQAAVI